MSVRDLDSDEGLGAAVTVPLQGLSEGCQTPVSEGEFGSLQVNWSPEDTSEAPTWSR